MTRDSGDVPLRAVVHEGIGAVPVAEDLCLDLLLPRDLVAELDQTLIDEAKQLRVHEPLRFAGLVLLPALDLRERVHALGADVHGSARAPRDGARHVRCVHALAALELAGASVVRAAAEEAAGPGLVFDAQRL